MNNTIKHTLPYSFLLLLLGLQQLCVAQTTLSNRAIDLEGFEGEKILYIVLPSVNDSTLTSEILRFQEKHADKVQVIVLVSGSADKIDAISDTYAGLTRAGILLSEGIREKAAGSRERESVMQWITDKKDGRIPAEKNEAGNKYFLSEHGALYATLDADISLDHPIVLSILNTRLPATPKP